MTAPLSFYGVIFLLLFIIVLLALFRNKYAWLGASIGFLFSFFSGFLIPNIWEWFLALLGTKSSGGNWGYFIYVPLYTLLWTLLGILAGFVIYKGRRK